MTCHRLTVVLGAVYCAFVYITLAAPVARAAPLASYDFGAAGLDLSSSVSSSVVQASDLIETDGGARTEFGLLATASTTGAGVPLSMTGNGLGWSRREAPAFATETLSFDVTPAAPLTVDYTGGSLTFDAGAYSTNGVGGNTFYDFQVTAGGMNLGVFTGPRNVGMGETVEPIAVDLTPLGEQAGPVMFEVAVANAGGATNGVLSQAGGWLDDLVVDAQVVFPGVPLALFDLEGDSFASVDADANSVTTDLTDLATGTGALSSDVQAGVNRRFFDEDVDGGGTGLITSRAINYSMNRENPSNSSAMDTFYEFTLSPEAGYLLDVELLTLDAAVNSSLGGTTSADYELSYSTNGTDFTFLSSATGPMVSGAGDTAFQTLLFDLSGLPVQSGSLTFRVDPISTGSTNGTNAQRGGSFDNVAVYGASVEVPEPATASLLIIASACIVRRRGAIRG